MSDCQPEILKYQQLIIGVVGICVSLTILLVIVIYRAGRSRRQQANDLEQRVRERTVELNKYVDSLRRSQTERTFLLDGISKRLNASLATMKGLGTIAATYDNMPSELVKNIDITTDTLADILQQIARGKKL